MTDQCAFSQPRLSVQHFIDNEKHKYLTEHTANFPLVWSKIYIVTVGIFSFNQEAIMPFIKIKN